MTKPPQDRPFDPDADRPRAGSHLVQGALIVAIVLLIAIATVSLN
jgi:hypothetical protein